MDLTWKLSDLKSKEIDFGKFENISFNLGIFKVQKSVVRYFYVEKDKFDDNREWKLQFNSFLIFKTIIFKYII